MSTILAFDTSSETASVSLLLRGELLPPRYNEGVSNHSQQILPMIQQLLDEAGISVADCDAIAFGCGPGSFTGVRTACGVAQGLGYGSDRPLIPVVSLMAMAERCRSLHGASDVLAVLDARMNEVYWAQYRYEGEGEWAVVTEPGLAAAEAVTAVGSAVACGNGLTAYATALQELPVRAQYPDIMPDSGALVMLARAALAKGRTITAAEAQPLYLRNKVAYTTIEREKIKAGVPC